MKILEKINEDNFKIDLFLVKKEGFYLKFFQEKLSKKIKLITLYDNLSKNRFISWIQYKIIHKKVKRSLKNPEIFLEKYVKLLGFKENLYPYLRQSNIFVSSSRYEWYLLILCEAICLNKPIIATEYTRTKKF